MEASERPQLRLDSGADGTVRLLEDRIVVESLTISDEDAARVIRQRAQAGEEPARTIRRTVEIGARVLDREDTHVEVDFVRREYERAMEEHRRETERLNRDLAQRVEAEIRGAFGDAAVKGTLGQALDAHVGELADLVDGAFGDGTDAVPRKIQELVERRNREFLDRLSADDDLNPLRPLLTQFSNWVRQRREEQNERDGRLEEKVEELLRTASELAGIRQASEAVAEAEEAGTRKGRSFEERVHVAIETLAARRGDAAHHTGAIAAEEGGKKGDTVVELGAGEGPAEARIAFEAKTDRGLTRPEAWRELNGAMEKRNADYAILVVASETCVPSNTQAWVEYEGNKMIVTVSEDEPELFVLEAAYAIARSRVLSRRERSLTVDAAGVRDAVEEALSELRCVSTIKKHLTGVTNSADSARNAVTQMEERVKALLARIDELVALAEAPESG